MGPTQELAQKVSQRYGWSTTYQQDSKGYWTCTVVAGFDDVRAFRSNKQTADEREGKSEASQAALNGLRLVIENEEAKEVKQLSEVFPNKIEVYSSTARTWEHFWKGKPEAVGIDVEGNQISPPVLLQISLDHYTIIEVPRHGEGLSTNFCRLLQDESIVKVFCDNFQHKDKTCIGITKIPDDLCSGHIVDLEALCSQLLGPVKVGRGLSRIVSFCMPELKVQIRKPKSARGRLSNVGRFCWVEQGKAPRPTSLADLSEKERQYAALDSWCTLQAYKRLKDINRSRTEK